jgi:hypothetical protein
MRFIAAWRLFRRMQGSALAAACLIYAGAALHAWSVVPATQALKVMGLILAPGVCLVLGVLLPLAIPVIRRWLSTHVWTSFRTGFGQTPVSVISGIGVLGLLAAVIYWQTGQAASGAGRLPGGLFSGYAAGIGVLVAQFVIGRLLERDPTLGRLIRKDS